MKKVEHKKEIKRAFEFLKLRRIDDLFSDESDSETKEQQEELIKYLELSSIDELDALLVEM